MPHEKWTGVKVRNEDGRTGTITGDYAGDYVGFCHRSLTITVDGGGKDYVQLNTDGPDSGAVGWEWFSEGFSSEPTWLPLGDHNPTQATHAPTL